MKLNELVDGKARVIEERIIRRALKRCGGNQTKAAKRLGISRMEMYRKLKRMTARDLDSSARINASRV